MIHLLSLPHSTEVLFVLYLGSVLEYLYAEFNVNCNVNLRQPEVILCVLIFSGKKWIWKKQLFLW